MSASITLQNALREDAGLAQFYEGFNDSNWRALARVVKDIISNSDKFAPSEVVGCALNLESGNGITAALVRRLGASQSRQSAPGPAEARALMTAALRHLHLANPSTELCTIMVRRSFDTEVHRDFHRSIGSTLDRIEAMVAESPYSESEPIPLTTEDISSAIERIRREAANARERQWDCLHRGLAYVAGREKLYEFARTLISSCFPRYSAPGVNLLETLLPDPGDNRLIAGVSDGAPIESAEESECPLLVRQSRGEGLKKNHSQRRIALQYMLEIHHLVREANS